MSQLLKCPSCRTRLVPHPEEMRSLRHFAGLTQREMAGLLGVKASHVAYLENGRRLPSGALILRYRKVERMLLSKLKRKLASESREVQRRVQSSSGQLRANRLNYGFSAAGQ